MLVSLSELLYIDPAATSVLITSITSICVALGATAIIIWRKLKKNVKKVLKVDENAGKKVEDDLVVYDEQSEVKTEESQNPTQTDKEQPQVNAEGVQDATDANTDNK